MRIIFAVAALFVLSGCETMEFTAVDYHHGYNYGPSIHTTGHISYTLGYYSDSYYNGYRVYGTHGHRYYHAPRNYSHHRHYSRPPVVVVHQHVHTSICYARGGHSYVAPRRVTHVTPPRHTPPRHVQTRHRTPPRATPPRHTPPVVRNDRNNDRGRDHDRSDRREDRQDRQHDKKRKRK